ncbi:U1 small nuclear ribonucleoprotein A isoform X2 [Rhizophagus clarus]|uniref:U1 small nuclear ribonucleoprotein A isoform X2 n=1 Tax=Rhizophagus clarus TaxID=94130 RepID=A0A8H3LPN0_9GLOM|nr:U1 small nuclear ribonucleoprotein A isoform X2 [Rhizophagus clarus]
MSAQPTAGANPSIYVPPAAFNIPQPGIPNVPTPVIPPPAPKQPPCTTPNNTIYINNLNEKIKLPALKKALSTIFEQYGEILDIVAHKNFRMRGQAFVVFKEQESATNAIKGVQGFALHGKPMVIQYAKTKSDATAILDGTSKEHQRQRLEAKEKRAKEPPTKKFKANNASFQSGSSSISGVPAVGNIPDEYLPPNNILFLQNLPNDITGTVLTTFFGQYSGFKEVRSIHPAKGIAFVEYDTEPQAMIAKEALSNYPIAPDHKLKITYAKK